MLEGFRFIFRRFIVYCSKFLQWTRSMRALFCSWIQIFGTQNFLWTLTWGLRDWFHILDCISWSMSTLGTWIRLLRLFPRFYSSYPVILLYLLCRRTSLDSIFNLQWLIYIIFLKFFLGLRFFFGSILTTVFGL